MQTLISMFLILVFMVPFAWSKAKYRYDKAHEDTVRVLIIYNYYADDSWHCPWGLGNGGIHNNTFTLEAIKGLPKVKSLPFYRYANQNSLQQVFDAFKPQLPHVIVHINGGSAGANSVVMPSVFKLVVDSGLGFVSIGDDAARVGPDMFGFTNVQNGPAPMGGAMHLTDLWISLDTTRDVPQGHGIITYARRYLMDDKNVKKSADVLMFKPYNVSNGRCCADADKYDVLPDHLDVLSFMGFQSGWDPALHKVIGGPKEQAVIAVFADGRRRAVLLSYQPISLVNRPASEQIVYDAIMWAALYTPKKNFSYQVIK
ncbi:MAG: hypothetical protein HQK83_13125 [Fibrobacteria bacterium]|nr:hypothetical protein [Fibrobacteria bacterium]